MPNNQQQLEDLRRRIATHWPTPTVFDAWAFTVLELSEVGDLLIRLGYAGRRDYVRNTTVVEVGLGLDLIKELGDTYMMLLTLSSQLGIDLDEALADRLAHFRTKFAAQSAQPDQPEDGICA